MPDQYINNLEINKLHFITHGFSLRALEPPADKQRFGAYNERNTPQNAGRRQFPGRLLRHDAGRGKASAHIDDEMGHTPIYEHLQTLRGGGTVR